MKKSALVLLCLILQYIHTNAQWVKAGDLYGAKINCVAFYGTTLFTGTDYGFYTSSNNGISWIASSNGISPNSTVRALVKINTTLAIATSSGIYLSTNNAANWTVPTNKIADTVDVVSLAVIGTNLFAGSKNNGVFISSDNGINWTATANAGLRYSIGISSLLANGTNLYALSDSTIYISTNNASSWTQKSTGIAANAGIEAMTQGGGKLFVACNNGIYKADNPIASWASANVGLPANTSVAAIISNSANTRLLAATSKGIYLSKDTGKTWRDTIVGIPITAAINKFTLASGNTIYAAGTAGFYSSSNNGSSWSFIGCSGIAEVAVPALFVNTAASRLFAAAKGNGIYFSTNSAATWTATNNGLALPSNFNSFSQIGNTLFASSTQSIYSSVDNGNTWTQAASGIPSGSGIISLASSGTLLFALTYNNLLYQSADNGSTWTSANTGLPLTTTLTSIAVSGSTLYLGTDTDGVYKTTASAINWTTANTGIPDIAQIRSLAASGNTVYASTNAGFYKSTNNAANWTISASNLPPSISFSSIALSGNSVFALSESGVYMSNNNASNWQDASSGLPSGNELVQSLLCSGGNLFVGSDRQGIWKRSISEMVCTLFPPSILTSVVSDSICSGTALSLALSTGQATNFTWIASDNADISGESLTLQFTSTLSNTLINTSLTPQIVDYTVVPNVTGSTCPAISQTVSITVNPKPLVNTSSTLSQLCSKTRLAILLSSSVPAAFTWQAGSNANVTGESTLAQSTTAITDSLVNSGNVAQQLSYSITATSLIGSCSSAVFTKLVQLNPLPVVTVQASTNSVCPGQVVTLSGQGASTYVWSGNISDQTPFVPLATNSYSVIGTDVNGCKSSNSILITVNALPHLNNLLSKTICTGNAVSLQLTSDIASTFQWQAASNTSVNGESTLSQNTSQISDVLVNLGSSVQTINYSVTPISTGNNCSGTTQNITVTVNPQPTMTSAVSAVICDGATLNIPLTASIAASFTWVATSNSNVTGESTTIQSTYTLNNLLTSTSPTVQQVSYTISPTSINGSCIGIPQTLTVTVNPKPQITSAAAITICSGTSVNLNFSSDYPSSYIWLATDNANTSGESTTAQTSSLLFNSISNNSSLMQNVSYMVTPIASNGNCVGNTQNLNVSVAPQPVISSANTATICSGNQVGVNFTSTIPSTFSWYAIDNPSTSGESIGNHSGNILSDTLFNATANIQYVNYFVTPLSVSGNCIGNSQNLAVTVNMAPTMTSTAAESICTGATVSIPLSSNIPSAYSWIAANNPNVSGESTFNQNTTTLNNTLTNLSPTIQTVTYTITPTAISGSCSGIPQTLIVQVSPIPTITSAATAAMCSKDTLSLLLVANIPSSFSWQAINNPNTVGESTSLQNSSLINNSITSTVATIQNVSYTITPVSLVGNCAGPAQQLQVSVRPLPLISANALPSSTLCLGDAVSLVASGASSYVWSGNVLSNVPFTPSVSGGFAYVVTGTDSYGCKNTLTKNITVTALPDTALNLSSNGNTISSAASGAIYQWQKCNPYSNIAGANGQNYTVTANGYYRVIIRKNNCSDTSACVWAGTLGTSNIAPSDLLEFYPNPANDALNITAGFAIEEVKILDCFGRQVYFLQLPSTSKININLNLNKLSAGVYTLVCKGNSTLVKRKLIVE